MVGTYRRTIDALELMPTIFTHAVSAVALASAFPDRVVPHRLVVLGAICAIAPDVDVISFRIGVRYEDLWGHRGLTHSLAFAFAFAFLAVIRVMPIVIGTARRVLLGFYLFMCTASHGLLDALTNGGLGVAFFSPFDPTRYFFPFRPIAVSPIGAGFFSERGFSVLWCEIVWVWMPCLLFAVIALITRRMFLAKQIP